MKYSVTHKAVIGGDNRIEFPATLLKVEDVAHPNATISVQATFAPSCLSVMIECETTDSQDVVTQWARAKVDRILNRISFEYGLPIAEAGPPTVRCTPADGSSTCTVGGTIDCCPATCREIAVEDVRKALDPAGAPDDAKCYWLRHALSNENLVARYMLLFRLLLDEKGPTQGAVDNFIRAQFTRYKGCAVEERPSTRPGARPGQTETAFTKLRNEVGHVSPSQAQASTQPDIQNTVAEIRKFCPDLVWLVKQAMCGR